MHHEQFPDGDLMKDEIQFLRAEMERLRDENVRLELGVDYFTTENQKLSSENHELRSENKELRLNIQHLYATYMKLHSSN